MEISSEQLGDEVSDEKIINKLSEICIEWAYRSSKGDMNTSLRLMICKSGL